MAAGHVLAVISYQRLPIFIVNARACGERGENSHTQDGSFRGSLTRVGQSLYSIPMLMKSTSLVPLVESPILLIRSHSSRAPQFPEKFHLAPAPTIAVFERPLNLPVMPPIFALESTTPWNTPSLPSKSNWLERGSVPVPASPKPHTRTSALVSSPMNVPLAFTLPKSEYPASMPQLRVN